MPPEELSVDSDKPIPLKTGKVYAIRVKGGTLTVELLGADGRTPLKGKRITLDGPGGRKEALTGADGRASFKGLQPGTFKVVVDKLSVVEMRDEPRNRPVEPPNREVRARPGAAPVRLQAARVPVVFVHGVLGSELYVRHGSFFHELWPNLGQLALSADTTSGFMQNRKPGDRHIYLLAMLEHAYHPDGNAAAQAALRTLQRGGLEDLYHDAGQAGSPSQAAFSIEVGDIVQNVKRTMPNWLIDHFQRKGANLADWHYGPMVASLQKDLGYKLYLQPNAKRPFLAADRKPPARPPTQAAAEDLFFFPYDWRLDPKTVAGQLASFIANVKAYTQHERVHLVAHSLGTLVSRCYAATNSASIERLIMAGGPHLGSAETLGAALTGHRVNDGVDALFHDPALRWMACTLPSTYSVFPRWPKDKGPQLQIKDKATGILKTAHGPTTSGQINDELRKLVEQTLASAAMPQVRPNPGLWDAADRLFQQTLGIHPPPAGKTIVIYEDAFSDTNKALYFELDAANKSIAHDDSKVVTTSGDGTVPTFSAMPWQASQVLLAHNVSKKMGHGGLYNSPEVLQLLNKELLGQGATAGGE